MKLVLILTLTLTYLLSLNLAYPNPFKDPLNLKDGPFYADVSEVTFNKSSDGNYTIKLSFRGYLPIGIRLKGVIYIDKDSLPATGCKKGSITGADYALFFDNCGAGLYKWYGNAFRAVGKAYLAILGNSVAVELPSKYFDQGSRVKLLVKVTTRDPLTAINLPWSSLGPKAVEVIEDGRDNLPPWCDLKSLSIRLNNNTLLEIDLAFFDYPIPTLLGDSISAKLSYELYLDSDGNMSTGKYGADYLLELQAFKCREGPFRGMYIAGYLFKWDQNTKSWRLILPFPGFVVGNRMVYEVPLRYLSVRTEARLFSFEQLKVVTVDYVPDNYFNSGWIWGKSS
ncbi:MAG: hypothetical protein B6U69_01715 [Thermofilum sp. ex4484_15]|nr:MAG: hypothetical protein B6U69_01715 [Thermofilum sp. ex4484_15]